MLQFIFYNWRLSQLYWHLKTSHVTVYRRTDPDRILP